VATIFLPLTFLTGFYGMNFTKGFYEPASSSIYGFYGMVVVMLLISSVLLLIFRKRGWV
jgi:magnesium transporter